VTSLSEERVQEIKDSFTSQGLMQTFEATLTHIALGHIEIAMPHRPAITQQHGFFHGGVMGALADGDTLIAVGHVIKTGKTLIVAQAEVWIEKQGARKKCAVMLMTLCVVKHLGNL
jgi:acyl-coenzyme A thioesterase PaaI-like protein